jgi:hypothetical protein
LKKNIEPSSHKKLEMEKLEKNDGVEDYCWSKDVGKLLQLMKNLKLEIN